MGNPLLTYRYIREAGTLKSSSEEDGFKGTCTGSLIEKNPSPAGTGKGIVIKII
jgi:hypothetical protein